MKLFCIICFLLAEIVFAGSSISQSKKDLAKEKRQDALDFVKRGKIHVSIGLLEEAQELDPDNFRYPYEIAFIYFTIRRYDDSAEILKKLSSRQDITDELYQLLGKIYKIDGEFDEAIKNYKAGIKRFPQSGMLYMEMGICYLQKENIEKAIDSFEEGIKAEPEYAENYYLLAKIFNATSEKVWTMIYGELFLNLDLDGSHAEEISKILYDNYSKQITIVFDGNHIVDFSKILYTVKEKSENTKKLLPFGNGVYEPLLKEAISDEMDVSIYSLNNIRKRFVENYFAKGLNVDYPNALLDYQGIISEAGHIEAYNYWILMNGNQNAFDKWKNSNNDKWKSFLNWLANNKLKLDSTNLFIRTQYE